jgi:hypothetical protein
MPTNNFISVHPPFSHKKKKKTLFNSIWSRPIDMHATNRQGLYASLFSLKWLEDGKRCSCCEPCSESFDAVFFDDLGFQYIA